MEEKEIQKRADEIQCDIHDKVSFILRESEASYQDVTNVLLMERIARLELKLESLALSKKDKCDCLHNQACIECGEDKGLDGGFWKVLKNTGV